MSLTKKIILIQSVFFMMIIIIWIGIRFELFKFLPLCLFRETYGYICPTCGVTRSIKEFFSFNFGKAFLYHPTFFIFMIYVGIIDIVYLINTIFKKNKFKFLYPSIPVLGIFLTVHVIQYFYRLCMIANGLGFEYL